MTAIELIDPERFREALAKQPDPEMAEALRYYDELVAAGRRAAMYLDQATMTLQRGHA